MDACSLIRPVSSCTLLLIRLRTAAAVDPRGICQKVCVCTGPQKGVPARPKGPPLRALALQVDKMPGDDDEEKVGVVGR